MEANGVVEEETPWWVSAIVWVRERTQGRPKTVEVSRAEMERRVARFKEQIPIRDRKLPIDVPANVREAASDLLSPRRLYPIIGPAGDRTVPPPGYAIHGPEGFQLAIGATPPGTGPALHLHNSTDEIFVVLEGRFAILWGEHGENEVILEKYDAIAVPPNVVRTFKNVGDGEGYIMPIVLGGRNNLREIVFTPDVERRLAGLVGGAWVAKFKAVGASFRAGRS